MALLHPSGGLIYHLRAWRWRRSLWVPFHAQVEAWLEAWRPPARDLVLIGPSAGYALNARFLARFRHIHVREPDVLARRILARRFPAIGFRFDAATTLASPGDVAELATRHADAALLFCNLLGQEPVGRPPDFDRRTWLAELDSALHGRAWASWHELASTARPPDRPAASKPGRVDTLEQALALFWQGGEVAIHDHETFGMGPQAPRQYALWQLLPGRWHLIEWLRSA